MVDPQHWFLLKLIEAIDMLNIGLSSKLVYPQTYIHIRNSQNWFILKNGLSSTLVYPQNRFILNIGLSSKWVYPQKMDIGYLIQYAVVAHTVLWLTRLFRSHGFEHGYFIGTRLFHTRFIP